MEFLGAIFDLDGTLIDSNGVWEKIDREMLRKRGIPCPDSLAHRLAALTYEEAAEEMRKLGVKGTDEELTREFNELAVREYRHSIFLKEGARDYLDYLKVRGVKMAVATASPKELYEPVLRNNHVYSFFDVLCTTGRVGKSKDHPDIYLYAASQLGLHPEDCVVFEDVLKGIVSARNAGMKTVGVYDKYSEEDIITIRNTADKFIFSFTEMFQKIL